MKKQILGIIFILALQFAVAQQSKKTVDYDLNFDDSKYNDSATVEFCLQDSKNRNFCLYHNIRKIKDFDYEKYDIVAVWSKGSDTPIPRNSDGGIPSQSETLDRWNGLSGR